jgi:hypothetical protein
MADTAKKASEILRDSLRIPQKEYDLMQFNARRYGMTDAEVEDAVLRMINASDSMKQAMKEGSEGYKQFLLSQLPTEFGKTKTFNAKNVLEAIGSPFEKGGNYKTAEEKLISLYRSNPNMVRNRVAMNKDFGWIGADNLDKLVFAAQNRKEQKPEIGWGNKIAGTFFYPRSLEAMQEGRSPSWKDVVGDIGENVLMAMPVGAGAAAAAAKLPKAAQVLAAIGANSMVPLISETYDASVYDPSENLDRSVFQGADVATGATTNIVAPYMAHRIIGRGGSMLGIRGASKAAREGIPAGGSEEAKKVIDGWLDNGTFVLPNKTEQDAIRRETWKRMSETKKRQPDYQQAKAADAEFRDGVINEATKKGHENILKFKDATQNLDERAKVAAGFMKAGDKYEDAIDKATKLSDDELSELFHRMALNDAAHNKLKDYLGAGGASWLVNRYGNQKNADAGLAMLTNLVAAVDEDINLAEKLGDYRDEQAKAAKDEYRSGIAGKILAGGLGKASMGSLASPQDTEDAKWLGKIATDPSIVRGAGEGSSTEFKNWWNTRGIVLLGKSGAFPGIKE